MIFLTKLLLFPVTGPVYGLRFVLEEIRDQAEAAMVNPERIQAELIELNLRYETGEISASEFEAAETELIEQLNLARRLAESVDEDVYLDEAGNEESTPKDGSK